MAARHDRRVVRTRTALVEAFNHLVLRGRQRKIGVSDIVEQARVGRSTFYDHYASAEDLHMAALSGPFAILADAAAGAGDPARLEALLRHFWDNRRRARETLEGRTGERAERLLAAMVEERLDAAGRQLAIPARLAALQLASAALAPVRGWVTAEAPCTAAALARAICGCGEQMGFAMTPSASDVRSDARAPG